MDNLNDNPTPVEMVKYPAALIYLSGLGEETPEKILEILEAGKALKDKNEKQVKRLGTFGKTIHS